ncbi:cellulose biosynthesis protein BcsN [Methylobacterium sp. EM32]|uniref:cellulose biosynthesis protein BcsN n=1 Tax=Methylobacterium sp. EM32 TaxID=3163481 RepID=UPI0033B86F3D
MIRSTSLFAESRGPSRAGTLLRGACVLLGLGLLGACQTAAARRTGPHFEAAFTSADQGRDAPLVSLPNRGPVASVQETRTSAGLRQRIVLGQSRGRIDLVLQSGRAWDDSQVQKPSRGGIAAELATLEDGNLYRIVRRPVHNAYGRLGVAVSDRCAYAWQWIDALQRVELGRGAIVGPITASLRVQHCYRRATPAEVLLADLSGLRIGAVPGSTTVARASHPRRARPVPPAVEPASPAAVERSAAVPPPSPGVMVNASRTLVMAPPTPAPQTTAAPAYLVPIDPAPSGRAIPAIPRPTGNGLDRARYLTDALPTGGRSGGASAAGAPNSAGVTRGSANANPPPYGW